MVKKRHIHILVSIMVFFLILFTLECGNRTDNKPVVHEKKQDVHVESQRSSDEVMQDNDGMIEIVDLAGRTVKISTGDDIKIILDSNYMIYPIATLFGKDGNPFTPIVGWKNHIKDTDTYELFVNKFPEIVRIPNIGSFYGGDFSIEKAISLNPDIFFVELWNLAAVQEIGLIEKLEKVGVKTVFIDFYEQPIQNTIQSMLLLGQIFEKTVEASKFLDFYFAQMQKVSSVVVTIQEDKKPLVFMEEGPSGSAQDGEYWVYGSDAYGRFVEYAGGKNYGTEIFGPKRGKMSAEQLFVIDPDVIIGIGTEWSKANTTGKEVRLGYKAQKKEAQERLKNITHRTGWKTLKAVKNNRIHNIFYEFERYPSHFAAIQQIAKWLYPDTFSDLDPEKALIEFHDTFLPISYSGLFWVSLEQ